jgi:hypothetical protein
MKSHRIRIHDVQKATVRCRFHQLAQWIKSVSKPNSPLSHCQTNRKKLCESREKKPMQFAWTLDVWSAGKQNTQTQNKPGDFVKFSKSEKTVHKRWNRRYGSWRDKKEKNMLYTTYRSWIFQACRRGASGATWHTSVKLHTRKEIRVNSSCLKIGDFWAEQERHEPAVRCTY